jgi:integrase
MAKIRLTDAKLKSLKGQPGKRYAAMDIAPSGFGVRVSPNGRKTFVLRGRYPGPNASKHYSWRALGEYPALTLEQARAKAGAWLLLVKQGKDPAVVEERARLAEIQKQRAAADNTFSAVAEAWFKAKLSKERIGRQVEVGVRSNLFPKWADRPIVDITEDDVFALIKRKAATSPSSARNLLGHAKRLFTWAIDERAYGLTVSPAEKLNATKVVGEKTKKRRRTLSDDEIRALWRASYRLGIHGTAYRLLLLTGCRLNEVVDMSKPEIDRRQGLWTIPPERMKGKDDAAREHVLPLTSEILAEIDSLQQQEGKFLFSLTHGRTATWINMTIKKRLDALMREELGAEFKAFVNHDLRRTVRTRLSSLRIPEAAAEALMAHAPPPMVGTYNTHDYLEEKREALEKWAAHLRTIVNPKPDNVVALRAEA